jgi:hypothetical protein
VARICVSCEDPVHGWLPLTVTVDGQRLHIDASDVPNDPVRDLENALDSVVRGIEARVFLHLEPGAYAFLFSPNEDRVGLTVTLGENSEAHGDSILSVDGNRREILLPFWRFLKHFKSRGFAEPHWPIFEGRYIDTLGRSLLEE